MKDALRHTGITLVDAVPWGAHLCLFYETKEDLLSAVIPYLKAGLESREFCTWAVSEPLTEDEARQALSQAIPDFGRYLADRSIEIFSARQWYLDADRFDSKRLIDGWHEKLHDALSRGYEGVRASGNAFWLKTKYWKDFSAYERELDAALAGRSMTVLCTYPLTESRAADVLDLVRVHQCTMALRNGDWKSSKRMSPKPASRWNA